MFYGMNHSFGLVTSVHKRTMFMYTKMWQVDNKRDTVIK